MKPFTFFTVFPPIHLYHKPKLSPSPLCNIPDHLAHNKPNVETTRSQAPPFAHCCAHARSWRGPSYFLRATAHLRAAKMRRAGWERREPVLVASPLTTAFVTARSAATGRRRACRPMLCPFPYKSRAAAKFCRVGKEMARILPPLSRHRRRTRAPSDARTEGASFQPAVLLRARRC